MALVAVLVGSAVALVYHGFAVVLAVRMPRLVPAPAGATPPRGRVSVVIAARDEEADLPDCLDALLAQDYPDLEILVVDGGSTDRTREVALARAPRVRLLTEPPLPEGWVGKNWACHQGAAASTGEFLLFVDADVRCHATAVRTTVAWAERERAELATLAPRIETVGFWEKVVLPFMAQMVLTYFRTPRVNRPDSKTAMANGQFLLVRRSAYDAAGGHAAVRGAVLEDVRLAQEFRRRGFTLRVAWAPELVVTRMYRDRREMFEGLLKNVHGTRYASWRQVGFAAGLVGFFYLPLAVLPFALLEGSLVLDVVGAILVVALFAKHVGFARGTGTDARYGLLFPLAVGFYLALVVTSIVRGVARRPVAWKGRSYPLKV